MVSVLSIKKVYPVYGRGCKVDAVIQQLPTPPEGYKERYGLWIPPLPQFQIGTVTPKMIYQTIVEDFTVEVVFEENGTRTQKRMVKPWLV